MPIKVLLFTKKDCPNCPSAKKALRGVADELREVIDIEEYDLDNEEDLLTALQHQVMSTPALVVDERLIAAGRALTKEEIVKAIESAAKN